MSPGQSLLDPDPEALLRHLYRLLSGPSDQDRPWARIRELFLPSARIRIALSGSDGVERLADWSVTEFAEAARAEYAKDGFWEKEIACRVERFGNIAHVFSTYESRTGSPDSRPVGRGISSVQFLRLGGRWRIAGLAFHLEQPNAVIPSEYLPASTAAVARG